MENIRIENNTIVAPVSNNPAGFEGMFFFSNPSGHRGHIIKNNILQGFYDQFEDGSGTIEATVQFNYLYSPENQYRDGDFAVYSDNVETKTVPPGFTEAGIKWQTDGTDQGTISEFYSLASGAPALTAGEGGTFCGAFGLASPDPSNGVIAGSNGDSGCFIATVASGSKMDWLVRIFGELKEMCF